MYYTLCRAYRGLDDPSKEKEVSNPSKALMREHEGKQLIIYHYNIKGQHASKNLLSCNSAQKAGTKLEQPLKNQKTILRQILTLRFRFQGKNYFVHVFLVTVLCNLLKPPKTGSEWTHQNTQLILISVSLFVLLSIPYLFCNRSSGSVDVRNLARIANCLPSSLVSFISLSIILPQMYSARGLSCLIFYLPWPKLVCIVQTIKLYSSLLGEKMILVIRAT